MGGKMSAAWWRAYRERRRLEGRTLRRRSGYVRPPRGDRSAEYARRRSHHETTPLPLLMPELQRGARVAFWDDELRLDLHQEGELARLEGRDPVVAIATYRSRELAWQLFALPLSEEIAA